MNVLLKKDVDKWRYFLIFADVSNNFVLDGKAHTIHVTHFMTLPIAIVSTWLSFVISSTSYHVWELEMLGVYSATFTHTTVGRQLTFEGCHSKLGGHIFSKKNEKQFNFEPKINS